VASAYYITQKPGLQMIQLQQQDVFLSTLLHPKLKDYSLCQIALLFFMLLFAITQLLCHVNKHCKQA